MDKSVVLSCVVPRYRHVRDIPAVAARAHIDRAHAGDHRIEDVLQCVMLRALVREKSGWTVMWYLKSPLDHLVENISVKL